MESDILKELKSILRPPAFPGSYFISFEGIEGAGKSSQIVKVKQYLESKDFRVLVLREPGSTPFGERLRQAILSAKTDVHPVAEANLFAASRAQLLHEVTLKELATPGTIIIYDRYIDSTLAYQGKARGLGIKTILELHKNFPLSLVPHLTLYLKISLKTSMERQETRNNPKDYFESKGESFYQKLIDGYDEASIMFPERIHTVDGDTSEEKVFNAIIKEIDNLIFGQ